MVILVNYGKVVCSDPFAVNDEKEIQHPKMLRGNACGLSGLLPENDYTGSEKQFEKLLSFGRRKNLIKQKLVLN